jgi:hypothetical protein
MCAEPGGRRCITTTQHFFSGGRGRVPSTFRERAHGRATRDQPDVEVARGRTAVQRGIDCCRGVKMLCGCHKRASARDGQDAFRASAASARALETVETGHPTCHLPPVFFQLSVLTYRGAHPTHLQWAPHGKSFAPRLFSGAPAAPPQ